METNSQNMLNKALNLHQTGNLDEAEKIYLEILSKEPRNPEILNYLGVIRIAKNDFTVAEKYIREAISIKHDAYYYENLSRIYDKNPTKQIKILEEAIKKSPCGYEIYFILGLAYKNNIEYKKAEKAYLKALELKPEEEKIYYNLAILYLSLNNPPKALENFKKCIELNPDDTEAKYFLSLGYFRIKDYETGGQLFENRLCRDTAIKTQLTIYPKTMQKAKLWQGEDISDKILYTYYEAGFGDMIMFARYIPELKKRCKKLIIKPQRELYQLFKDNFSDIEVMDFFDNSIDFDYHIPFLSIPYTLGLKNSEIFIHHDKYLTATKDKTEFFKNKYFNNNKYKIAVKWQGNTYYETGRVINVEAFEPLFKLKNTQIYSAQTFEGSEELKKLSSKYNIIDLSADFKDFSYTAGALNNVDLVISSDSSLAHLAGAMGIPCIVLLPYNYNWRWHTDLNKCDWYDSLKLYRLDNKESWNELMERITESLLK